MADIANNHPSCIVIGLDVQAHGVVISATVNGRFNARYAALQSERVPGEVQALVAEILGELRPQSLQGVAHG